jgi:hypothetical protein
MCDSFDGQVILIPFAVPYLPDGSPVTLPPISVFSRTSTFSVPSLIFNPLSPLSPINLSAPLMPHLASSYSPVLLPKNAEEKHDPMEVVEQEEVEESGEEHHVDSESESEEDSSDFEDDLEEEEKADSRTKRHKLTNVRLPLAFCMVYSYHLVAG